MRSTLCYNNVFLVEILRVLLAGPALVMMHMCITRDKVCINLLLMFLVLRNIVHSVICQSDSWVSESRI